MKAGSWKLPAGIILGLAGGFLLRPVIVTERGDLRLFAEEEGAAEASAADSEASSGKSAARASGKRSAGSPLARLSSGDAVEDVRDLIAMIDVSRDQSEINPMELIRRVYLLSQLQEGEVVDVLSGLSKDENVSDPLDMKNAAGAIALMRLAELNGPEAMRMMYSEGLAWMSDDSDDWLPAMVMNSWVAADPDGAKRWFEAGIKESDREEMAELMENDDFRQAYYDGMAKHDPEALAREIGDDSDSEKRDQVMTALVRSTKDSAELVELLDRCTGGTDVRTEAMAKLIKADPQVAAAWVEKQASDDGRDDDIANVASAMMEQESGKGIEWYLAQKLADDERAGDRLSRISNHLAEEDLERAAEWVKSRPDDAARDSAEITMAGQFMRKDLDEGMGWLTRVGDPERRDLALQGILEGEWDYRQARLRDGVIEAAERAGMGEAARNFKPE